MNKVELDLDHVVCCISSARYIWWQRKRLQVQTPLSCQLQYSPENLMMVILTPGYASLMPVVLQMVRK